MKNKSLIIFLASSCIFFGVNAQTAVDTDYKFYKLNTLSQNVSSTVKDKIIASFMGESSLTDNGEYDLENMKLGSFDSTDVQAVYVHGINNNASTVLVFYVKGDLVADMAVKEKMAFDNEGNPVVLFKDHVGETVFDIKSANNGDVILKFNPTWQPSDEISQNSQNENYFVKNGPSLNEQIVKSFWDRWTSCVSTGFNQMFNGHSTVATIAGLGCMSTGWYCYAGAALGCAAHSAVYH